MQCLKKQKARKRKQKQTKTPIIIQPNGKSNLLSAVYGVQKVGFARFFFRSFLLMLFPVT